MIQASLDFTGRRVIVVGNGPSAAENGELIDSYDIVLRVQASPIDPKVGLKWDVWFASFSGPCLSIVDRFDVLNYAGLPDVVVNCLAVSLGIFRPNY